MIRRVQDERYQAWVGPYIEIPHICTHTPLAVCKLPLFSCEVVSFYYNIWTVNHIPEINKDDLVLVVPWNSKMDYDLKFVEEVNKRWNEFYD